MEVYQIFEMTGFDEMLEIEKKLRYIDISGLKCLGEGMYGAVYRIDNEQIIKVFYGSNSRQRVYSHTAKRYTLSFYQG